MSRLINATKVYTSTGTWLVRAILEPGGDIAVILSKRTLDSEYRVVHRAIFESISDASRHYTTLSESANARTRAVAESRAA